MVVTGGGLVVAGVAMVVARVAVVVMMMPRNVSVRVIVRFEGQVEVMLVRDVGFVLDAIHHA